MKKKTDLDIESYNLGYENGWNEAVKCSKKTVKEVNKEFEPLNRAIKKLKRLR